MVNWKAGGTAFGELYMVAEFRSFFDVLSRHFVWVSKLVNVWQMVRACMWCVVSGVVVPGSEMVWWKSGVELGSQVR